MTAAAYLRRHLAQIRNILNRGAAWWLDCTYRAGAATYPRRGWRQAHHRGAEVRRLAHATMRLARMRVPNKSHGYSVAYTLETINYVRAWTRYRKAVLRVRLKTHRRRMGALYALRLAGVMPVRPHGLRAHYLPR